MSEKVKIIKRKDGVITGQIDSSIESKCFCEFDNASVIGIIESEPKLFCGEKKNKLYNTIVRVKRLSGTEDLIPIVIPNLLIGQKMMRKSLKGKWVKITGVFKSKMESDHLNLFLFAREITIYEDKNVLEDDTCLNKIYLNGCICKKPIYRFTPLGKEISDLFIAVNTVYGESYYIPCIAWGKCARLVSSFKVGEQIELHGRIQSRIYYKRDLLNPDIKESKTAYEISANEVKRVKTQKII